LDSGGDPSKASRSDASDSTRQKNLRAAALIPAYNEEKHISQVVAAASRHLPVLVVDDGSKDETAASAEGAGAVVIRQRPNQGKGVALRTGFRRALDDGYEAVVTLDADGQHDPSEIPEFLQVYAARRADLIIGARDFSHMPPVRRLANTLGQLAFSWALRRKVHDNQSGYRLISHRLLEELLSGREHGFEFEMEMIVTCVRSGFTLDWVPIRTIYAGEASHIQSFPHLERFLRFVWRTRKSLGSSP
jgi:glycosyltransferase involved in cell wall biosynthesis